MPAVSPMENDIGSVHGGNRHYPGAMPFKLARANRSLRSLSARWQGSCGGRRSRMRYELKASGARWCSVQWFHSTMTVRSGACVCCTRGVCGIRTAMRSHRPELGAGAVSNRSGRRNAGSTVFASAGVCVRVYDPSTGGQARESWIPRHFQEPDCDGDETMTSLVPGAKRFAQAASTLHITPLAMLLTNTPASCASRTSDGMTPFCRARRFLHGRSVCPGKGQPFEPSAGLSNVA